MSNVELTAAQAGSPTVINDHPVVILSPIKEATPRGASRYFDAVGNLRRVGNECG